MIDTLMVVWTSGMWKRFLRNTGAFLLLFLGICVLLFLIMTSGGKWSGLAVTVARTNSSAPSNSAVPSASSTAAVQPAPAPTAASTAQPYIEPIILQNPILPDAHNHRSEHKHFSHHHLPSYVPSTQPTTPNTPPDTGFQDPTNPTQNLP